MSTQAGPAGGDEAVWTDVECGSYTADLPLWRELVASVSRDSGCDLLELGCGTGRVSLALAGPACRVTAIDVEPALVGELQQRAAARGAQVEAVVADARSFELERRFDIALAPMQLMQLLHTEPERIAALERLARHLRPGAIAALALLDLDEEWEADPSQGPVPDMLERGHWVYSSHPVAVRRVRGGSLLELDRVRRSVSPQGKLSETFSRVRLALVTPERLEREARAAGLVAQPRMRVPATDDHSASAVVVLRNDG